VAQKIPSIKGFPPKRPEITTSCGPENPIHQGIPTKKRPETTTSCGPVNPIHEGIPIKDLYENFEKMNA
jgi:hypothetical protein